jgi:hypothetical protein
MELGGWPSPNPKATTRHLVVPNIAIPGRAREQTVIMKKKRHKFFDEENLI